MPVLEYQVEWTAFRDSGKQVRRQRDKPVRVLCLCASDVKEWDAAFLLQVTMYDQQGLKGTASAPEHEEEGQEPVILLTGQQEMSAFMVRDGPSVSDMSLWLYNVSGGVLLDHVVFHCLLEQEVQVLGDLIDVFLGKACFFIDQLLALGGSDLADRDVAELRGDVLPDPGLDVIQGRIGEA